MRFLQGINGIIRVWKAPTSDAFVAIQHDVDIRRAAISPDGNVVAAGAADGTISVTRLSDHARNTITGHTSYIEGVLFMPDGVLLSYGFDGRVRVWRTDDLSLLHSFDGHGSRVEAIDLGDHGRLILSVGDDGRLFRWSPDGQNVRLLFSTDLPLMNLQSLAIDDSAVVADIAGSVWHVQANGTSSLLRSPNGDIVTLLRASSDGRLVAVGTEHGTVTVFDSLSKRVVQTVAMEGPLRQGRFAADNSMLILSSERRNVNLISLIPSRRMAWREISLDARDLSFSPDQRLVAIVCSSGSTWFYSFANDTWTYVRDHYARTSFGRFSADGRYFLSSDSSGVVVLRDVAATLINSSTSS
jgi:WD40 repeat protein